MIGDGFLVDSFQMGIWGSRPRQSSRYSSQSLMAKVVLKMRYCSLTSQVKKVSQEWAVFNGRSQYGMGGRLPRFHPE